ncbi:hypothetical protein C8034_v000523 [Colletotrichum sidae]|uniref:Uncharacterized protein n=1 Tax=Colletotrichum sidae TaxID=1347389 RepID=A0A4R8SX90_9PEZI|nr:hypothetical protein C8034_v000523 [Colletotrichum sidae]
MNTQRPRNLAEQIVEATGGNLSVARWEHTPTRVGLDDESALLAIQNRILHPQNDDPQILRQVAVELAGLLPEGQPSKGLPALWELFISLAQQTPSSNIAMLDLVVILDHLSLCPKTMAVVNVDGFEQLSRLHGLDRQIRDCMLSPRESTDTEETLSRWISLNAFAALLWSYNLVDGSTFAIQQLRSAFEDRHSSDADEQECADARLMAAAQWAIRSCQRLYHLSVTSDATSPGDAVGGREDKRWMPGARFRGRAGFSFERWEFWQQGFEEAHELGSGGIEAKVEAGAASGLMAKVLYAGFD